MRGCQNDQKARQYCPLPSRGTEHRYLGHVMACLLAVWHKHRPRPVAGALNVQRKFCIGVNTGPATVLPGDPNGLCWSSPGLTRLTRSCQ